MYVYIYIYMYYLITHNILYYKIGGFVVDRKSIDLLTKSVRKASEMRLA